MSIQYSPPHVVHAAYARSCVGIRGDIEKIWSKLSHEVYVIERRLDALEFATLDGIASLTLDTKDGVKRVGLRDLYKPVYFGEYLREIPGWQTHVGEKPREDSGPVSWWVRVDLVVPSERIRFPALPEKVNQTEWFNMGELRELYSYDGFGFSLRDAAWGRE